MREYIVRETGYPGTLTRKIVGELVRCKDCRWAIAKKGLYFCRLSEGYTHDKFYCSNGERKEDADK